MIRKLITLLVLLGLLYMGYRIIDPVGAQNLVSYIQSLFNTQPHTIVLDQDKNTATTISLSTGIDTATGINTVTGTVPTDIANIVTIPLLTTGHIEPESTAVVTPSQQIPIQTTQTKSQPQSSSSHSLSAQDMQDLQRLLHAIVE